MYSEEVAKRICERLANGEPLAKICRDEDMPDYSTARRWEDSNDGQHSEQGLDQAAHTGFNESDSVHGPYCESQDDQDDDGEDQEGHGVIIAEWWGFVEC